YGVHLGKEDLSPEDARKLIPDKIIGVSTSGKGLKRIKEVDYIAVGSIFPSPTKPEKKPIGSDILTVIKKEITIPLIAIGGINLCNVEEVIEKGADGVAVISAVENSPDPEKSVKKFKEKVKKAWKKTIKTEKKNRNQKD
ncbi:thiamine phosphate synthase, partial [bacterium]|nr:thiamine phosphate synthase [bacterium]